MRSLRELASTYTVYALDCRGHGDSHKPTAPYHFQISPTTSAG